MSPSEEEKPIQGHQDPKDPKLNHPRLQVDVYKADPDRITKYEWLVFGASIIVVALNIFTLWYVKNQADAAVEQTKLNRAALTLAESSAKSSDEALVITKQSLTIAHEADSLTGKSLEETRRSNGFQEKMTRLGTRAYIGIENPTLSLNCVTPPYVTLFIKNFGKSSAYHVYSCAQWVTYDQDSLKYYYLKQKEITDRHKREDLTLAPELSTTRVIHHTVILSPKDSILIVSNSFLFVVGRVVYVDVFDNEHFVSFCLFFDADSKRFLTFDKYNEAD